MQKHTMMRGAISGVVGSMPYLDLSECTPSAPKPVLMISGSADNLVDREASFNRWLTLNNCTGLPVEEVSGIFTCSIYTNCDDGVETTHCIGTDSEHCWPGSTFSFPPLLPVCSSDLNASQYSWDFFERNSI